MFLFCDHFWTGPCSEGAPLASVFSRSFGFCPAVPMTGPRSSPVFSLSLLCVLDRQCRLSPPLHPSALAFCPQCKFSSWAFSFPPRSGTPPFPHPKFPSVFFPARSASFHISAFRFERPFLAFEQGFPPVSDPAFSHRPTDPKWVRKVILWPCRYSCAHSLNLRSTSFFRIRMIRRVFPTRVWPGCLSISWTCRLHGNLTGPFFSVDPVMS